MNFKEIYIFCPTDVVSGGVNSLHILCKSLKSNNINAKMFYKHPANEFLNHPVIKAFNVPYITEINDYPENLLIVPEANTAILSEYLSLKKMVYWLGIYFYFKKPPFRFPLSLKPIRKIFSTSSCYFGESKNKFHDLSKKIHYWNKKNDPIWKSNVIHMSNSYYAADFIKSMGVNNVFVLHNPIREEFYKQEVSKIRRKKILFGPKTPKAVIRLIKGKLTDFECIRLKHISASEVRELYSESMLFIELGNFAGRDRMPREAALSGCVIITSRNGSANYFNDLQLPDYYKLNTNSNYLKELTDKVKAITSNYEEHHLAMKPYTDYLFSEFKDFDQAVSNIFERIN